MTDKILELKFTVNAMKNAREGTDCRKICKCTIKREKNEINRSEESLEDLWGNIEKVNVHVIEILKSKETKGHTA